MGSYTLALSGFGAEQIEAPVIGDVPPEGIQRINQRRKQPMYADDRFRSHHLTERERTRVGKADIHHATVR